MKYIKDNWKFLIFTFIICLIGSYYTTLYTMEFLDKTVVDEAVKQVGSYNLLVVITVIQILFYGVLASLLGLIFSNNIGLWKNFEVNKDALKKVIIISLIGGILISAFDRYFFGSFNQNIEHLYDAKPNLEYIISSFTYGGVFEELLIRFFLMSLLVWIISKMLYRKEKSIPDKVFVISNLITALLFAAGHLPSTSQIFDGLDAMLIIRCFSLNGSLGLVFGMLYRKYGIYYSMLAHFGCHLISKIIWILFI